MECVVNCESEGTILGLFGVLEDPSVWTGGACGKDFRYIPFSSPTPYTCTRPLVYNSAFFFFTPRSSFSCCVCLLI